MLTRIRELERVARQLEPDDRRRAELIGQVFAYADDFIRRITTSPAYVKSDDNGGGLYDSPIVEEGIGIEAALHLLRTHVDTPGINPASDRFLGYIPGGGLFPSALGDFLAAVTNRYAAVYFASPGAVRMENILWNWMADIAGYPDTRGGTLTSGGSIANLAGIVAARDAHGIRGEEFDRSVVYLTEHAHHSINKSLRIAGCGQCLKRMVPVDGHFRMNPDALESLIRADRDSGLDPWLVVASAGTTNTGSVDPLDAIADVAEHHNLWFHVDGAYGAFFALCKPGRRVLIGMDRSDSLVMDPHKTLFLPYGTGAILVRDRSTLLASHHEGATYMQDTIDASEELSPADLSPELTRHFRGLRLWLPLKLMGVAPFRAALEEKMLLARYFHDRLRLCDGFEVGPPPELSVATYRYIPSRGDADAFNHALAGAIQRDGRVFISTTRLNGRFTLRLAVGVFRTHLDAIEQTIDILVQTAARIAKEQ